MRDLAWARGGLGLVVLGCQAQSEPVKKPPAPDMSQVIADYQAPTAALDANVAQTLWDAAHSTVDVLNQIGIDQTMLDAIQSAVDEHLNGMQSTQSTEGDVATTQQSLLQGDGYLKVTRICNGWGPEPVPDKEANGFIELYAGFTETGFDPVIWGGFSNCKYRVGDTLIELEGTDGGGYGSFSGYLGESVPFAQTGLGPTLYRFDVLATVGDQSYTLAADFEIDPSTVQFRFRVHIGQGYFFAMAGRELVGVRATNGDFGCSEMSRTCTNGTDTVSF